MAKEPAYIRNLRALTRAEPQNEHLESLEQELYSSGNDRATVLLFGSFIEVYLGKLLAKSMRSDLNSHDRAAILGYDGIIGTFSSKIMLAYALAIIGPIARFDLDLIRLLRNEFAHARISFNLETKEAADVCKRLRTVDLPDNLSVVPLRYHLVAPADSANINHPRTRFIACCHCLTYRILVAIRGPQAGDRAFTDDNPIP